MKNPLILAVIVFFTLFSVTNSEAQVCWQKYDPPNCKSNVITEFGISKRLNPMIVTYPGDIENTQVNFDFNLGMATKINSMFSAGGLLSLNLDQIVSNPKFGIRGRLNYYPHNNLELNFSPGLILLTNSTSPYRSFAGFSMEAGANFKNYVGLYSRVDFLNREDNLNETSVNLGIRTGGALGAVSGTGCIVVGGCAVAVTAAIVLGILVTILSGAD